MTPERQYPLSWPPGWKRTQSPQHSRFDTSPDRAVRGLLSEIERLGGSLPVISSNAQYKLDGMPYARQGYIADTGVAVYFQRKGKPVVFACDTYHALHDNIHAISKTIEAMRAIDRHGASDMLDRAFTGFTALPPPIVAGMKRDWWVVLGVHKDIGGKLGAAHVQAAYRRLASQLHTDKPGGDHDKMAELNIARDEALQEIQQ